MSISRETIAGATVVIDQGQAFIVAANPVPATAGELRDLALLLFATADELDGSY